jgi:hypothetical protein
MISSEIGICVVMGNFKCNSYVEQLEYLDFIVTCVGCNKLYVCLCTGFNMGKYNFILCSCFLSFNNIFILILHCGRKLRVTAIHRHWPTRLHGVITQKFKYECSLQSKPSVLCDIINVPKATAFSTLFCGTGE